MNKHFFLLKKNLSIRSILKYLNITEDAFFKYNKNIYNILDFKINNFSSISNSSNDSLTFINKNYSNDLNDINGVCLMNISIEELHSQNTLVIPSENPKLDFCNIINEFCKKKEKKSDLRKINNSLISNTSIIGSNLQIGNFSKIESNVKIGNNVIIGNNVSISDNCVVGNNVHIMDGVCIDCSMIGDGVIISQNTVIGKNGFGFHTGFPNSNIFFISVLLLLVIMYF